MIRAGSWAMQQLAGFLSAIGSYPDEETMTDAAVHHIAESLDAEVCALVSATEVISSVGYGPRGAPAEQLVRVAGAGTGTIEIPGAGQAPAGVVQLRIGSYPAVVIARATGPLDGDEVHLLRAMAQVFDMAVRLRRTADAERHFRERVQHQAEILQRANAHLAEADQLKSDLLSMTSHELRTPLVSINGFATLLLDDDALDPEDRRAGLEAIQRHGRRILRLVDDVLLLGKLEGGRFETTPEEVPLVAAISRLLSDPEHGQITVSGPDDAVAWVDPDHLEQIVLNLVTNAERYGAPPISIEVESHGEAVRFAVIDHGPGVDPSFIPRLFEAFARDASNGAGTGLGLAIIDGLTAGNGGWIHYERDDVTRFVVQLPAVRASG